MRRRRLPCERGAIIPSALEAVNTAGEAGRSARRPSPSQYFPTSLELLDNAEVSTMYLGGGSSRMSASGPLVLLVAGLLTGCAGAGASTPSLGTRELPADPRRPVQYVALGDSTVEGIGASSRTADYVSRLAVRLRSVYPTARYLNLGVGGATAADVAAAPLRRAVALQPDLVTLSVGPNDITGGRTPEQYERDIEAILATLTNRTRAVVVINLIPDLTVTPRFKGHQAEARLRERVVRFNEVLLRQARTVGAEVIDLYEPSRREVPQQPELISADGYHPSDLGYDRWATLMWQGVESRIPRTVPRRGPLSESASALQHAQLIDTPDPPRACRGPHQPGRG